MKRLRHGHIPIRAAKDVGNDFGYDQVLIFAWHRGSRTQHVTTWGRSQEDCDQIAQGGNYIKREVLGWPEAKACAEPSRVRRLKDRIAELEDGIRKEHEAALKLEALHNDLKREAAALLRLIRGKDRYKTTGEIQEFNVELLDSIEAKTGGPRIPDSAPTSSAETVLSRIQAEEDADMMAVRFWDADDDSEVAICETCVQMTHHRNGICLKCGMMSCGHPPSAVESTGEGTNHCRECEREALLRRSP